jgi:uncharacterized protein YggE
MIRAGLKSGAKSKQALKVERIAVSHQGKMVATSDGNIISLFVLKEGDTVE